MKFNSIVYAACILMVSLSAKADLIEADDYITFNWEAVCGDCNSVKGVFNEDLSVGVSGNIILSGYTLGDTFDQSNVVSFQYNGPSDHIDNLVVHNANFDLNDQWVDLSDANEAGTYSPVSRIDGYTHFAENMIATGWVSEDLTKYTLDFTFDTFVPLDESGEFIPFTKLGDYSSFEYRIIKETFNISYILDGSWAIQVGLTVDDLGNGANIASASNLPTTSVPEPSTLVLFGISILGFLRLRTKKS
ncbi:hypothetical protein A3Q34_07450 [Colwellia sp. PAMC 20917]|uniref:PEP-CTERM sorting domain-containing protein n=1 Tax=Colwellia sp. PAMC 20917 TaxID=1816218 RepID=UPI000878588D|nr:PEP-CTERM sorting domain-containing protein [Colwellia sp. PAMC 20917]AOW76701.1 hypothetical protein A3Q34_07450 [Colwellia sp. PAMC 20917]